MAIDKNEVLLTKIQKNLYEVESLLSTQSIIDTLKKYNINLETFPKNIQLYISKFQLLKTDNDILLEMLNEKLSFINNNAKRKTNIQLYHLEIAESITFIENHINNFFDNHVFKIKNQGVFNTKKEISFIHTIEIKNFYSIEDIKLVNLKDKKEIYIVGENGDGKTLLLQSIAIVLSGVQDGDVFDLVKSQQGYDISLTDSMGTIYIGEADKYYRHILAYGASRYNNCQMKEDETGYLTLFNNIYDLKSPVKWLQYLDHNEKSGKENILSVKEAKSLLNKLLNSDIEIDIAPDKVTFTEKGSEVIFNQLSAGYKGVVTIICDLIARLYEKQPYVTDIKEFQGIVLIDEVELHLHPKWKYDFMKKLRDTFPLIQFIVTTHSPTVILGASKEAVFYKIYKDDGKVNISNQIANEGYTNNSLVSSPLFDMETITSRDYDKKVSSDDYIYEKIHQIVAQKIKENINVNEEELLKLIDEELDKI